MILKLDYSFKRTVNAMQYSKENVVIGRNAVWEALKSGRTLDTVYVSNGASGLSELIQQVKQAGAVVKQADAKKLDTFGRAHQGIVALCAAMPYQTLDQLIENARKRKQPPFLLVCDQLEDPHNLGALMRTAECVGVHGIVIPKRRSVSLSPIVAKTSAGASSLVPVARVANLAACIDQLKKQGIWVYCADMQGESWCGADLSGPIALVVGSEGKGISRLVREKCDKALSLPMSGQINSLNVSVAGGILLYEIMRQRLNIQAKNFV